MAGAAGNGEPMRRTRAVRPGSGAGAWSTYWYRGERYESNIGEALNIWQPLFNQGSPRHLNHLNPQTQDSRSRTGAEATHNASHD